MAYEAQGRQIAADLRDRYGKLLEARLGTPIVLVFERGEWEVPRDFIFKFGYSGSGPDCFHAFLTSSGFKVSKSDIEKAQPGTELSAPGHDPTVAAFVLGPGGLSRTSANVLFERERLTREHERGVELLDRGEYRTAIEVFEKVLAEIPEPDPMTFLNIAVCHAHLGDFGRSLGVLEEALTRWPDHQRLRMNYEAIKQSAPRATVAARPSWSRQKSGMPATTQTPGVPASKSPGGAAEAKSRGGCFIATAACGGQHADVVLLRRFREDVLRPSRGGRLLITMYETVAPPAAAWIAGSAWRRALARHLIVRPAVAIAVRVRRAVRESPRSSRP